MSFRLQPVQVGTGSDDEEGRLVFVDDALVAVLVRLSDNHAGDAGKWFLEASFHHAPQAGRHLFDDLDQAEAWFSGP